MISNAPQISVIMSVYKEPIPWITQSIDSILNQTFSDFEFLIVDDNPEDEERQELLRQYQEKDERVKIIFNEVNIGLTKSLNKALDHVKGKYIARMDADDISHTNRFQIQYDFMESHPEIDLCGTWGRTIGDISFLSLKIRKMPITNNEIKACLLFKNPFIHSSVMFRKVIKNKEVRYNENAKRSQDYMLWYELSLMNATFYNINEVLLDYRLSSLQISSNHNSEQFLISNFIQEQLLKELNCQVKEEEVRMHLAICKDNNIDIGLDNKIEYLNRLNDWCKNDEKYKYYRANCAKYALAICIDSKKPLYISHISYLKYSDMFDREFVRGFLRCILK